MKYPVQKVVLPAELKNVSNGQLPAKYLVNVSGGGQLYYQTAWQYALLKNDAALHGIQLTYSPGGLYRTHNQQLTLFHQRFEAGFKLGGTNRRYQGYWYHLRPGMALAATPGNSNHGLGIAIDFALGESPQTCKPLNQQAINYLLWTAPHYGFSWEAQSEPWHLRQVKFLPGS